MILALNSQTLLVIGVLMIALVLIRLLLRPKRGPRPYESPLRSGTPAHMLDAPAEVGRWEVQMHETARNLMGELNTKIAIVEQLVRDANAAAERLERAIERSENRRVAGAAIAAPVPQAQEGPGKLDSPKSSRCE